MAAECSPTLFLLSVLVLGIFVNPCETQELQCQCIQTYADFIPPQSIKNIHLIPKGVHCSRKEIIVTLKDEKLVCLDPEAEWVMAIIKKIMDRAHNKKHHIK
ncbi:C-X-C motif chemokine 15-like [Castor canadensis]|jgi:hypothetical protein|uniref:C-X-C motif chemokine 15-like n=1 Tax=Castor canadensis TaxID=51338 RepID=A0AC58JZK4_CASCN